MSIDILVPLKTDLIPFAIDITIPSIIKNLKYNKLYVITKKTNFTELSSAFNDTIILLDEDTIYEGLTLDSIKNYFSEKNPDSKRAGWYFQQFIKLGIYNLSFITENYLIWDGDAVVLKPIVFFSKENTIFLERNKEYNKPYFETIKNLIGIEKQVNFSFIAEYMVFNKKIVSTLLSEITSEKNWWYTILNAVKITDLNKSGFSEYELYGNYLSKNYPNSFVIRNLNKSRKGSSYLGSEPSLKSLKIFSLVFDYISFENLNKKPKPIIIRYFMILYILIHELIKKITAKLLNLGIKNQP